MSEKHGPNCNRDGKNAKNTVQIDQHGRNVHHVPISNRAVTNKQRRVALKRYNTKRKYINGEIKCLVGC